MDFVDRMMGQSSAQRFNSDSLLKFTPLCAFSCSCYVHRGRCPSLEALLNKPAALRMFESARAVY